LLQRTKTSSENLEKILKNAIPFGGYKCPYCAAEILTPLLYIVLPGTGARKVCKKDVIITEDVAIQANENRIRMFVVLNKLGIAWIPPD